MRFDVGGVAAYAYTGGRALDAELPTIVFVHGAALDHSVWALQSRYFANHGYNVLAVDLPGHGRSAGAPRASVAGYADWLDAALDALGVGAVVLIGHSLGSLIALERAGRHPQRVSALALLAPSVPMPVAPALLTAAAEDLDGAHAMIVGWSFSEAHQVEGNPAPGSWMTMSVLRLMQRCAPGVLHADLTACAGYRDGLMAAASVRCPSLVITGQRDRMTPARNAAALVAALQGVRTLGIAGSGHSLMQEAPDAVLDALREFLSHPRSIAR
jgi:pimeloyl-ACP methyl ester carboxylesterase